MFMRRYFLTGAVLLAALPSLVSAQEPPPEGSYKLTATTKVGGDGGWDYVYADAAARRLYIPRSGQGATARITVFDLDSLKPVGEIAGVNAHGVVVDPKSGNGFASSKPVTMFDSKTLKVTKTIAVQGNPDGIFFDAFNERVYVFSHTAPNATVIDATNGNVVGTIDLGGEPEQAASDGAGRIYVALEDKDQVAVIDAKAMSVVAHYDLDGVGAGPAGLALDPKTNVLFVACHNETMVYLDAQTGQFLYALPIGAGVDGAVFNPATNDVFSSQGDGTLTIANERGPGSFNMVGTVMTSPGARTLTLDPTTGKVYVVTAQYGPAAAGQRRGPMVPGSFEILTVSK
jgi:DNA-binding beta-propeller fold protein YncE